MWAHYEKRLCFLHIPRTGGTTFKVCIPGFVRVTPDHHAKLRVVSDAGQYRAFKIFTIVRDPYARFASAYHRRSVKEQRRDKSRVRMATSFCAYVKRLLHVTDTWVQAEFLDHPFLRVTVYRYERDRLADIVRKYGGSVAKINQPESYFGAYNFAEWIDEPGIELITAHCARDFDELGYERRTYAQLKAAA